jgi:hypothetical protein
MPNSKTALARSSALLVAADLCAGATDDALRRGYGMTIAKMDLLCNMSFGGRGDAGTNPGVRVNVCRVFGLLVMMGFFFLGSLHAQTGQSALTGVVSDSSGAIVSGARVNLSNAARVSCEQL